MIFRRAVMIVSIFILIITIYWGRSTGQSQHYDYLEQASWSAGQLTLYRAWAGAIPAIAADMAVLSIFNIYTDSQSAHPSSRDIWWSHLHKQLRIAQAMDPYFKDIYRLTEGLLAFEANQMQEAVDILAKSEPYLHSSDPLLVASFIAHQELHDKKLALDLAKRAAEKPDAQYLAIGFASSLLKEDGGCHVAIQFLTSRLHSMPEKYQSGIKSRIQRLKASKACAHDI